MHIGRALAAALAGLFFMMFVSFDLVLFGAVALGSVVITVLLLVGVLGGALLGWMAGARKHRGRSMPPPPEPTLAVASTGATLGATMPPPPPPPPVG